MVEVIVGEQQVDLAGAGEQIGGRRLQQPAEAGAGVEDQQEQGPSSTATQVVSRAGVGTQPCVPSSVSRTSLRSTPPLA